MIVDSGNSPRASLLCVYNDGGLFCEMLASAGRQTAAVEVIGVDNRGSRFPSAASALNHAAEIASSGVLVFLHQDIEFTDDGFLERLIGRVRETGRVYGVAGVSETGRGRVTISTIYENVGGRKFRYGSMSEEEQRVLTLDECLIACTREVFERVRFDEELLDGWHLYAADFCLAAGLQGVDSYVLRSGAWHKSSGNLDAAFYAYEARLAAKYAGCYPMVASTCTWFPTGWRYRPFTWARAAKRGAERLIARGSARPPRPESGPAESGGEESGD